jgi:hypothetical protein
MKGKIFLIPKRPLLYLFLHIRKYLSHFASQWPDISLSLEKALKLKRHIVSPLVNSFDKREYEMGTCHEPFSEGNLAIQYEASAQNAVRESPEE